MGCYNCTKRTVGCHSNCEDYASFQLANAEKKQKIKNQKELTRFCLDLKSSNGKRYNRHRLQSHKTVGMSGVYSSR